jgi:hypothetical protein
VLFRGIYLIGINGLINCFGDAKSIVMLEIRGEAIFNFEGRLEDDFQFCFLVGITFESKDFTLRSFFIFLMILEQFTQTMFIPSRHRRATY